MKLLSQGFAHSKLSSSENKRRLPNKGLVALQYLLWFQAQELCSLKKLRKCGPFYIVIIYAWPCSSLSLNGASPWSLLSGSQQQPPQPLIPIPPPSEPQAKLQSQERVPDPRSHCWQEPEASDFKSKLCWEASPFLPSFSPPCLHSFAFVVPFCYSRKILKG